MKVLNEKKYKFQCIKCDTEILFSKEDCLVDNTYEDFWLNCPVCGREYDNQTYRIFRQEYIEEYDEKDKEIERLNEIKNELLNSLENLKLINNNALSFLESFKKEDELNIDDKLILIKILKGD